MLICKKVCCPEVDDNTETKVEASFKNSTGLAFNGCSRDRFVPWKFQRINSVPTKKVGFNLNTTRKQNHGAGYAHLETLLITNVIHLETLLIIKRSESIPMKIWRGLIQPNDFRNGFPKPTYELTVKGRDKAKHTNRRNRGYKYNFITLWFIIYDSRCMRLTLLLLNDFSVCKYSLCY